MERVAAAGGAVLAAIAIVMLWSLRLSVDAIVYVSGLGADGMPTARPFMVALVLIVLAAALIAYSARGLRARGFLVAAWAPSITFVVSASFFLVASQVPCTPGCPVPYGPDFTWRDFIHTTAAIVAFAAAAWGILQVAFSNASRLVRIASVVAAVGVAAISLAGGLLSLAGWMIALGAWLEFVATTLGVSWLVAFGVLRAVIADGRASAAGAHVARPTGLP